ncbi:MAG: VCBS repeat-containing protein [Oscillospiraceae bacterium]|nr:VCBS repeat-containing protein [Oscillospiraceae bacterium]
MKAGKNRVAALLLSVFLTLTCAGCMTEADELYSLPRQQEEYVQLQELIGQRIDEGSEYAAPTGGSNRQSVQLRDLDGDGVSEALAFLADSAHTPSVCIYRLDEEGAYFLYIVIAGKGSAVSSVEYADLNGDGALELIIAWQISGDIRLLSVYDLSGQEPVEVLSADCSAFVVYDLDGDGTSELLNIGIDYDAGSSLTVYQVDGEDQVSSTQAALSSGITEVLRARSSYLSDGTPALFVESSAGDELLLTDVFILQDGAAENITMSNTGQSSTVRRAGAYAADINSDRALELPLESGDALAWYSLDSGGGRTLTLTTYHNYDDGWYLILTDTPLMNGLSVSRQEETAGEAAVTFSLTDDTGEQRDILTIYTLTGENRLDRAEAEGRFLLKQEESTVYAAQLWTEELTEQDVTDNFNLIYQEWLAGDL